MLVRLADGATIEIPPGTTVTITDDGAASLTPTNEDSPRCRRHEWLAALGRDVRAALVAAVVIEVLRLLGVSAG